MKKITLQTKILVSVILLLVSYILFKPNNKYIYHKIHKELIIKEQQLKKDLDSIQKLRVSDKIYFNEAIRNKVITIEKKTLEIEVAEKKIKNHEKNLSTYRNTSFNKRFDIFTKTITTKDPI